MVCVVVQSRGVVSTGSDVTPAAVNWNNITSHTGTGATNSQTISAIDTPIRIRATWTGTASGFWRANGVAQPTGASPLDVVVTTGTALIFNVFLPAGGAASGTVTVTNVSDGGATLDTFTYYVEDVTDPPFCVSVDAWLDANLRAGDARVGDMLTVLTEDMKGVTKRPIEAIAFRRAFAMRFLTKGGVALPCSTTTPITQPDKSLIRLSEALHAPIAVEDALGDPVWDEIEALEFLGEIGVAHISAGGATFAASEVRGGPRAFTHNKPPSE